MTPDPLEALRSPLAPIDPDAEFAATLRARLQRALALPQGVRMLTSASASAESLSAETLSAENPPAESGSAQAVSVATSGPVSSEMAITPYLAVADARQALDWYAIALGARPSGDPVEMPDGRIGHAEIEFGGALVMLSDAFPEIGVVAPEPGQGSSVTLHVELADVDEVTAQAVRAGASLERPPTDNPYGRSAVLRDPFGHRWMLMTATAAAPTPADVVRPGDIGYVSLWTPDVERAATFYRSVLGWTYAAADGSSRIVDGTTPAHGLASLDILPPIFAAQRDATFFRSHAVADVDEAVRRIRGAGGQADDPADTPYGRIANCLDPDGAPFAVHRISGDELRGPVNGSRHGDISYLTLLMVDGGRTRQFYATIFGWEYAAGSVADGFEARDVVPMTGMQGGHPRPATIPMYRVDDIEAAVARVRAGGGTATDPQTRPYGLMSECTDDQGTFFYLGQH